MFLVSLFPLSFCLFADLFSLPSVKPVFLVNESSTLRRHMEYRHKVISIILFHILAHLTSSTG